MSCKETLIECHLFHFLCTVRHCSQCGNVHSAAMFTVRHYSQCGNVHSAAMRTMRQCSQCSNVHSAAMCTVRHYSQCGNAYSATMCTICLACTAHCRNAKPLTNRHLLRCTKEPTKSGARKTVLLLQNAKFSSGKGRRRVLSTIIQNFALEGEIVHNGLKSQTSSRHARKIGNFLHKIGGVACARASDIISAACTSPPHIFLTTASDIWQKCVI